MTSPMPSSQAAQGPKIVAHQGPSMVAPQAEEGRALPPALEVVRDRILELAMARALVFHEAGNLSEAENFYRVVLAEEPNHLAANANMGRIALELQNPKASLPFLKRVLDASPGDMHAWASYTDALLQSRKLMDAQVTLQQCRKQGLAGSGVLKLALSLSVAVEAWITSQTGSTAANSRSKFKVPRSYQDLCRAEVPVKEQDATLALFACKDFGIYGTGALDLVIRYPIAPFGWKVLGAAYHAVNKHAGAEAACLRSIKLNPTDAETHFNRGQNFSAQGKWVAAESSYREAIRINPDFPLALHNLLAILSDQGKIAEVEALSRDWIKSRPDDIEICSNLLFMHTLSATITPEELFAEHCRFGDHFEGPLRASWPIHTNSRDPNRNLKIGFVSADFCDHAVISFIEPIFAELVNCKDLQLHAYYSNPACDSTTRRLMGYFPQWNWVAAMDDAELARKIQDDAIDILIDLSGITTRHRLLTFARKPAPIQVSWIGYPGTTGLRAMDYYFADRHFLPSGKFDALFTEKIVRLPSFCAFQALASAPPVNELPALQNGHFTFGSFNRPNKITERVVELWAQLISALPGSRMILGGMKSEADEARLSEWFAKNGVDSDRLVFHRKCQLYQYHELHHQVDMCLDTFPYGGGVTSWHAIWMGVPTLTLSLGTPAGQLGAQVSGQMGLQGFNANDRQDFVSKGLAWADRLHELSDIRMTMRDRFSQTAAGNPKRLVQDLQMALRTIWRRWCAGLPATSFVTERWEQDR